MLDWGIPPLSLSSLTPYLFCGSTALCPDPVLVSTILRHRTRILFSFQRLSGIVIGSLIVSAALWHHAQIPSHFRWLFDIVSGSHLFNGSPASYLDLLSFRWLSGIMPGSPIISATLEHRVQIPFSFSVALRHRAQIPFFWHCVRFSFIYPDITPCVDPLFCLPRTCRL